MMMSSTTTSLAVCVQVLLFASFSNGFTTTPSSMIGRPNVGEAFASVTIDETTVTETKASAVKVEKEDEVKQAPMPMPDLTFFLKESEEEESESNSRYRTIQPGRYSSMENSIALPFLKRPQALDGSHAGDYGFDPLGFTEDQDLYAMQEAEIRHARLAMLAVVGWPMSELLAPQWMLQQNGCAPSVLNGFNPVSLVSALIIFGAFGFFEYKTCFRQVNNTPSGKLHQQDMSNVWKWGVAGDYGFDPLNLYSSIGDDAYSRKGLRELEISHGRSAMLGITLFAIWEKLTGHAIVEDSMFFHPNLLLPFLVAGYYGFNSIYQLEDSDTFVRFEMNSEGAARLENLKLSLRKDDETTDGLDTEAIMNKVSEMKDAVMELSGKVDGRGE